MITFKSGGKIFHVDERIKDLAGIQVVYRLKDSTSTYSYVGFTNDPCSRGKGHLYNMGAKSEDLKNILGNSKTSFVNCTNKFSHIKSKNIKEWTFEILDINHDNDKSFPDLEGKRIVEEMENKRKIINSVIPYGIYNGISIKTYDEASGFYE